jgi:hypothetical protein
VIPLPILVLHMDAATSWEPSREIIANELIRKNFVAALKELKKQ